MIDLKAYLQKLHKNLLILQEREAKYGGNAPVDLLHQIDDHKTAINLTEQVISGQLSETTWQENLKPLLASLDEDRVLFNQQGQQVGTQYNVSGNLTAHQVVSQGSKSLRDEQFAIVTNWDGKTSLREFDLSGRTLDYLQLRGADLIKANLSGASLRSTNLEEALLHRANLQKAKLNFTNLNGAYLEEADLSGADLRGAKIEDALQIDYKYRLVWEIVNKRAAGLNLWRGDLRKADLRKADLSWARLTEAKLSEADLSEANLREADLQGAVLRRANLQRANLTAANLSKATLHSVFDKIKQRQ